MKARLKAIVICNPAAGHHSCAEEVLQVAAFLESEGCQIDAVEETHGPSDATTYARQAAVRGCDVVFVAGGDGTLAEAVDGLVGSETALAALPGGGGNVFARQLNLPVPGGIHPRPLVESARLLLGGQVRRVDVGRITPLGNPGPARHFLCWGGAGFDAQVNRNVAADPERKRRLGPLATFITSFLTLRDFAGTSATVRIDGHRVSRRTVMLCANNIQLYGIFMRMAHHAVIDDGLLDVFCFQGTSPTQTFLHAIKVMFNRHIADPRVEYFRARRVDIITARPLAVHVDGDAIGNTPITIQIVPKALNLLAPSCAPASLFVDGSGLLQPETTWEWVQRMARDVQSAIKERSSHP